MKYCKVNLYSGAGGIPLGAKHLVIYVEENTFRKVSEHNAILDYVNKHHQIPGEEPFYFPSQQEIEVLNLSEKDIAKCKACFQLYPDERE